MFYLVKTLKKNLISIGIPDRAKKSIPTLLFVFTINHILYKYINILIIHLRTLL